jgi:hypothetical protein
MLMLSISITNLRQMVAIYKKLQHTKWPPHHMRAKLWQEIESMYELHELWQEIESMYDTHKLWQ